MNTRNKCNEKLRQELVEYKKIEEELLEAELEGGEDHVFSEKFEANMQELFKVRNKKERRASCFRFTLSAAMILIVAGIMFTTVALTKASLPTVDIVEWFDNHFVYSKGTPTVEDEVLAFEESRLGYIPDGFKKMGEEINHMFIDYMYSGPDGQYISVHVSRMGVYSYQDNEEVVKEVFLNDAGYECVCFIRQNEYVYIWEDDSGLYYYLSGNAGYDELMAVVNGIYYKGGNE